MSESGAWSGRSQPGDEVARLPLADLLAVDGTGSSRRFHRRRVGGAAHVDRGEADLVDQAGDDAPPRRRTARPRAAEPIRGASRVDVPTLTPSARSIPERAHLALDPRQEECMT